MPTRHRGFTLIELLVVVLIIGVLAAIAIPRYANVKTKTHVTTIKSDLRNLVTSQESYLAEYGTYYDGPIPAPGFTRSSGVAITLSSVSVAGWAAIATHVNAPGWACAVFVGQATPPAPAVNSGQIACQ